MSIIKLVGFKPIKPINQMRPIKVIVEDERFNFSTNINGTNAEINDYYLNQLFNFPIRGYDYDTDCETSKDNLLNIKRVEFLNAEVTP